MAFTPQGLSRFPNGAIESVIEQASRAKADFEDDDFKIHDLITSRVHNIQLQAQDYEYCGMKEVMVVVGPNSAYTCCSLAFSSKGLIGYFDENYTFEQLWWDPKTIEFFAQHDARRICDIPCLYEQKNKRILDILQMSYDQQITAEASCSDCMHKSFV